MSRWEMGETVCQDNSLPWETAISHVNMLGSAPSYPLQL